MTPFGLFCRNLRLERGELLKEMADKLGVSSAFLSGVETGKNKIPETWPKSLTELYCLNKSQVSEMHSAITNKQPARSLTIHITERSNGDLEAIREEIKQVLQHHDIEYQIKDKNGKSDVEKYYEAMDYFGSFEDRETDQIVNTIRAVMKDKKKH